MSYIVKYYAYIYFLNDIMVCSIYKIIQYSQIKCQVIILFLRNVQESGVPISIRASNQICTHKTLLQAPEKLGTLESVPLGPPGRQNVNTKTSEELQDCCTKDRYFLRFGMSITLLNMTHVFTLRSIFVTKMILVFRLLFIVQD